MSRPLIIDTDPGIDDALAILLACASPELELRALTTVAGNVPLARVTENALKLLELGGKPKSSGLSRLPMRRLAASPPSPRSMGPAAWTAPICPRHGPSRSQATPSTISSKPSPPPRRGA